MIIQLIWNLKFLGLVDKHFISKLKIMISNFCSLICNETSFHEALSFFRITKGSHCASDNNVFPYVSASNALPEVDVISAFDALVSNSDHPNIDNLTREIYRKGVDYEFGLHKGLMRSDDRSSIGLLAAMSKMLSVEIFVVCGLMPLSMIHGGQQIRPIRLFRHSQPIKNSNRPCQL